METLRQLSEDLSQAVEEAGRSVVRVDARRRLPASGVIWSADGIIVTADHVVERDEQITVGLADGNLHPADLVGRDPGTDLAVLRIDAENLQPAAIGGIDELKVGHMVLALGRPGEGTRATLGIVSALGAAWRTRRGGQIDHYLQTDVVMYPGFSGGPLAAAGGAVLGINSSALWRGISLTIPSVTVSGVVETLLKYGRMRRGYLGVGLQPVRLPGKLAELLEQRSGLLLLSVEEGSAAAVAGLVIGDILVSLGDQRLEGVEDLLGLLGGERVGQELPLKIIRAGEVRDQSVLVGEAGA